MTRRRNEGGRFSKGSDWYTAIEEDNIRRHRDDRYTVKARTPIAEFNDFFDVDGFARQALQVLRDGPAHRALREAGANHSQSASFCRASRSALVAPTGS